jgi:hypothetical protein
VYEEGQASAVALMKDWKTLFALNNSGWSKKQGGPEEDESWAKDMSLADMGLQNVQGQNPQEEDPGVQDAETEEEDEIDEDDNAGDKQDTMSQDSAFGLVGEGGTPLPKGANEVTSDKPDGNVDSTATKTMLDVPLILDAVEEDDLPRKRPRLEPDIQGKPVKKGLSPVNLADNQGHNRNQPETQSSTRSAMSIRKSTRDERPATKKEARAPSASSTRNNNKRKASEEVEDGESRLFRPTASSRAKRVATVAGSETTASVRQTRNSKKK